MKNKIHFAYGFTLLEFLIAFALSVLIIAGAFKIYISLLNCQRLTQAIAGLQHRSEMAFLILKKNIYLAGDATCLGKNTKKNLNPVIPNKTQHHTNEKSGTDVLPIQRCLFLKNKMQWETILFFIRDTHRTTTNKHSIFSLYRKIGDNSSEELVAGISRMAVCYITSQYNHTLQCLKSNEPIQWESVQGVHVELLLESMIQIKHPLAFYTFKNQSWKTQDKKLYKTLLITTAFKYKKTNHEKTNR